MQAVCLVVVVVLLLLAVLAAPVVVVVPVVAVCAVLGRHPDVHPPGPPPSHVQRCRPRVAPFGAPLAPRHIGLAGGHRLLVAHACKNDAPDLEGVCGVDLEDGWELALRVANHVRHGRVWRHDNVGQKLQVLIEAGGDEVCWGQGLVQVGNDHDPPPREGREHDERFEVVADGEVAQPLPGRLHLLHLLQVRQRQLHQRSVRQPDKCKRRRRRIVDCQSPRSTPS
mmetsp:Transcript_4364/g.8439  ORF Transcript_4364/g.8439 Transcript_4364/m.8439 type:complete len:225 (-) Transcript_4364:606-1280(-)